MRNQLFWELERVHLDPGRPAGTLDVVWDQFSSVAAAGIETGNGERRGRGRQVCGQDVFRVRPHFVHGEAELLRQSAVEPGRAVDLERVGGLVNDRAVLNRLGFA